MTSLQVVYDLNIGRRNSLEGFEQDASHAGECIVYLALFSRETAIHKYLKLIDRIESVALNVMRRSHHATVAPQPGGSAMAI